MRIKTLKQEVINQIAAGEVIIEPASIVKELVENSIDAGSSRIDIEIKDGGKKEIVISDDGIGISYDDIPLAFRRHATSKIDFLEDLDSLTTMGFRGEALSSIAAVADVKIITRFDDEELGSESIFKNGTLKKQSLCSFEKGTTITVSDLFRDIPARFKFLKSSQKEEASIRDIVEKLALSHPGIRFSYTNEDRKVFQTIGNNSLIDVANVIFGSNFSKHLYPFETQNSPMKISGLIGDLDARRTYRDNQIFFVNGRYIKSSILSKAYEEEWAGKLMKHQYPSGIIFIDLPANMIDVNVHPQKTEINILNKTLITLLFKQCIRQVLEDLDLIPKFLETEENQKLEILDLEESENKEAPQITQESFSFIKEKNKNSFVDSKSKTLNNELKRLSGEIREKEPTIEKTEVSSKKLDINSLQLIGTLFNTYILLEGEGNLYIIDQHAAHEAVLYEEYNKILKTSSSFDCQSIIPHEIEVTIKEMESFLRVKEKLINFGFKAELTDDSIIVEAVPLILNIAQQPELIIPMINYFDQISESQPDYGLEKVITMSCKAAIKAGNILDKNEIYTLLNRLSQLKNPYTCPHGRPVIQKRSEYEIRKLFKRVI